MRRSDCPHSQAIVYSSILDNRHYKISRNHEQGFTIIVLAGWPYERRGMGPSVSDVLASLESLVEQMNQAMTATLPISYKGCGPSKKLRPVINSQDNMNHALVEAQAAAEALRS